MIAHPPFMRQSQSVENNPAGLMSQQIWCWGRDIHRPAGNWLLEIGFKCTHPPSVKKNCASVYTLSLSASKRIIFRGFGVFFADDNKGGIFLKRYSFQPQFTNRTTLALETWSYQDLPPLRKPDPSELSICRLLTMQLIDWFIGYELRVIERLGIEYRRKTLEKWNDGKRWFVPAEQMASAWRRLSLAIGACEIDFGT